MDKKLEKFDDEFNLEFKRSKSKEIVMYVGIILMALTLILMKFLMTEELPKEKEKENNNIEIIRPDNANDIEENMLDFKCLLTDKEGNKINNDISIFGKGEYLVCNIEVSYSYSESIASMSFDFYSEDIELLDMKTANEKLDVSLENNHALIKRLNNNIISRTDLSEVSFYLYIKNNKNFEIDLNNVNIGIVDEDRVDYMSTKNITISNGDSRYYKENNSYIFEKVQDDGTFKKVNEYVCSASTPNNCYAPPASQSFVYENDNKNVTMISDYVNNAYVMFDNEKGVIGTYSNAVWLRNEDSTNTYIYVQQKDTNKYGIIDVNGKLIHDYNLDEINATTIIGMIDNVYSVENNMIVDQKNGKYGIVRINSNETVLDYNFDSVRLFVTNRKENSDINENYKKIVSGKYVKASLNGKWYLYSTSTKNLVFNEGYDYIHVVNDSIVVTIQGNQLNIKDINGNNLINTPVQSLATEYADYACCGDNLGVEINSIGDVVEIKAYASTRYGSNYNNYEFNTSSKTLNQIK